jgi:hypothetical protein
MRSTDGRRLDHRMLTDLWTRAVTQVQAGKSPQRLHCPFAPWTAPMLATVIARRFGVPHSRSAVRRLLHDVPGVLIVIVDGHPAHKAKLAKTLVASVAPRPQLTPLPFSALELHSDEWVRNDPKTNGIGRLAITGPAAMKREVLSRLRRLQKSPLIVRSFFQAPTTKYAAVA